VIRVGIWMRENLVRSAAGFDTKPIPRLATNTKEGDCGQQRGLASKFIDGRLVLKLDIDIRATKYSVVSLCLFVLPSGER